MNEFDVKAKEWDANLDRAERANAIAAGISHGVPLTSSMRALEYGCGTGLVSFALQTQLGEMTLADSSAGMLAVLQGKIAAGKIKNMLPVQLDLAQDPLPIERYQLIHTSMTLHHIPDTSRILSAFYELLDNPGYLCVADLDREDGSFHADEFEGHLGFDRDDLSSKAQSVGFKKITFSTVFNMQKKVDGVIKEFPIFLMVAEKY